MVFTFWSIRKYFWLVLRHIQKIETMANKTYQITENEPMMVGEPAVAYCTKAPNSDRWNPNVPFHCTQEEFLDHIHEIESGEFMTWEEHEKKFEAWKKEFLANRMK